MNGSKAIVVVRERHVAIADKIQVLPLPLLQVISLDVEKLADTYGGSRT